MGDVTLRLTIDRPVEEVFAFYVQPENHLKWQDGMLDVVQTSEGPVGTGTRFRIRQKLGGQVHDGIFEITEYERPNRLGITATTDRGMIDHRSLAVFDETGDSTRLTLNVWPTPRGWRRMLRPLIKVMIRRQLPRDFNRLKEALERGTPEDRVT